MQHRKTIVVSICVVAAVATFLMFLSRRTTPAPATQPNISPDRTEKFAKSDSKEPHTLEFLEKEGAELLHLDDNELRRERYSQFKSDLVNLARIDPVTAMALCLKHLKGNQLLECTFRLCVIAPQSAELRSAISALSDGKLKVTAIDGLMVGSSPSKAYDLLLWACDQLDATDISVPLQHFASKYESATTDNIRQTIFDLGKQSIEKSTLHAAAENLAVTYGRVAASKLSDLSQVSKECRRLDGYYETAMCAAGARMAQSNPAIVPALGEYLDLTAPANHFLTTIYANESPVEAVSFVLQNASYRGQLAPIAFGVWLDHEPKAASEWVDKLTVPADRALLANLIADDLASRGDTTGAQKWREVSQNAND